MEMNSMSNQFKNMLLNKALILETAIEFASEYIDGFEVDRTNVRVVRNGFEKIEIFGEKSIVFDLYYVKGGGTTLALSGTEYNREVSEKFGHFLLSSKCKMGERKDNMHFIVKDVDFGIFRSIIELLDEFEDIDSVEMKVERDSSIQYAVNGIYKDSNMVTYYKTTNKILVQGKPLPAFSLIVYVVNSLIPQEQIIEAFNTYYSLNIEKSNIEELFSIVLPNSHHLHSGNYRKLLLQALYNTQVNGNMFDYTYLIFPALKALEGHLESILRTREIERENRKFNMFYQPTDRYKLKEPHKINIADTWFVRYVEKCYNYFNSKRHGFFHYETDIIEEVTVELSPIIENVHEAHQIINDSLKLIDEFYK